MIPLIQTTSKRSDARLFQAPLEFCDYFSATYFTLKSVLLSVALHRLLVRQRGVESLLLAAVRRVRCILGSAAARRDVTLYWTSLRPPAISQVSSP